VPHRGLRLRACKTGLSFQVLLARDFWSAAPSTGSQAVLKTALILGASGQDGRLLTALLSQLDYRWLGLGRGTVVAKDIAWEEPVDITDFAAVSRLVGSVQPAEIYHLAAFHSAAEGSPPPPDELFRRSFEVNTRSLFNVLEAVRDKSPASRIFYAASSHVFGSPVTEPQDEQTPLDPRTIYGITKTAGLHACRLFRREQGVFASSGILYNHESVFRRPEFLSSKVLDGAIAIKDGRADRLMLGDLQARVDWGYAPEYVEAMVRILAIDQPDDFVVATGRACTVQEFVRLAFEALDLDWTRYVQEAPHVLRRRTTSLVGCAEKLRAATGWEARIQVPEMIRLLMEARATRSLGRDDLRPLAPH
jgi:GDPmannose 4,6-dehydratase